MSFQQSSLTFAERQEAQTHWDALMLAPSHQSLEAARSALKIAPLNIRESVLAAIVAFWRTQLSPTPDDNPFR